MALSLEGSTSPCTQKVVAKLCWSARTRTIPTELHFVTIADWIHDMDTRIDHYDSWVDDERTPPGLQYTPKVAPPFDGGIARFADE